MKQNVIIKCCVFLALGIMLLGCRKYREDGVTKRSYFFNILFVPEGGIHVEPSYPINEKEVKYPLQLRLELDGRIYNYYNEGETPPLAEFRRRVGDVYRHEFYVSPVSPVLGETIPYGIKNLLVESVSPYNEAHLAGSDLSKIIKVCYASYDERFQSKNQPYLAGKDAISYCILLSEGFQYAHHPRLDNALGYGNQRKQLLSMYFTEAPSQPKVKLRFILELEDGMRLECTEEIEIHEARS